MEAFIYTRFNFMTTHYQMQIDVDTPIDTKYNSDVEAICAVLESVTRAELKYMIEHLDKGHFAQMVVILSETLTARLNADVTVELFRGRVLPPTGFGVYTFADTQRRSPLVEGTDPIRGDAAYEEVHDEEVTAARVCEACGYPKNSQQHFTIHYGKDSVVVHGDKTNEIEERIDGRPYCRRCDLFKPCFCDERADESVDASTANLGVVKPKAERKPLVEFAVDEDPPHPGPRSSLHMSIDDKPLGSWVEFASPPTAKRSIAEGEAVAGDDVEQHADTEGGRYISERERNEHLDHGH